MSARDFLEEWPSPASGDDNDPSSASRHARLVGVVGGGHRWTRVVRRAGISAVAAGAGWAIYAEWGTIRSGFGVIAHTRAWFLLAPVAQFVAMSAFVLLQRRLLRAVGGRLPLSWLWSTAHLANAIDFAVPFAGGGMATTYTHRRFRQRGVEPVGAALMLTLAGIFSTVAFAVVVVLGAMLSGSLAAASGSLAGAAIGLGVLVAILVSLRTANGQLRLVKVTEWILRLLQRAVHRPRGDPNAISSHAVARISNVRLDLATVGESFAWAVLNWIADAACLVFAIKATGASVPWHQVLLVWSAGLGAQTLSPTPGGIGAVEVTMIAALVASGLHAPQAVAAVLLYRCVNAKVLVTTTLTVRSLFSRHKSPET